MSRPALSFASRKDILFIRYLSYLNHMNWYKQFGLCLNLHPFIFSTISEGSGKSARKCKSFLNWPIKYCLSLHLYPFFLVRFAKALMRLRKCAVSFHPLLLAYAISPLKCKRVLSGSSLITHFRPTHGTMRNSHRTLIHVVGSQLK